MRDFDIIISVKVESGSHKKMLSCFYGKDDEDCPVEEVTMYFWLFFVMFG